jgi:hypothetical protein
MADEPDERLIPRPPKARTTTDFIVIVFVIMVAVVLITLTVAAVLAAFVADVDPKGYFAILTDLMTTIISALVGYMAGRGSGRADALSEYEQLTERKKR